MHPAQFCKSRIHVAACLPWLALALLAGEVRAGDTIVAPESRFQVDHTIHLLVTNLPVEEVNAQWPGMKSMIRGDALYAFAPEVTAVEEGQGYPVLDSAGTPYQLYFTPLPIIGIHTEAPIVDEPRVPGHFVLADSAGQITSASLGIEVRGGYSQTWPKKSYRLEFHSDTAMEEEIDVALLGMRSDDDWNLLAMYNEPLRLRNVACNQLWRSIHAPYYQFLEPQALNGVQMEYAELFINGAYQGLYAVSERIDRKQLKLKKYNGSIRGELYKGTSWGATTFTSILPFDNDDRYWDGFTFKYPKEVTDWTDLHDFADFVVNAPEAEFLAGYPDRFDVANAVDYFIFLNLLRATDNTGKNIFIARYDAATPYFYVPYDLDGTFGMVWDGTPSNITNDLLLNGFYARLMHDCQPGGFTELLEQRWNELRADLITPEHINGLFQQLHDRLAASGVYEREMMAWPGYTYQPADLDYLSTWLNARLTYLDQQFNAPCVTSGISEQVDVTFSIQPNPAQDHTSVVLDGPGSMAELVVTDLLGRTVLRQPLSTGHSRINLTSLGKGMYLAQVSRNGRTATKRLVIN